MFHYYCTRKTYPGFFSWVAGLFFLSIALLLVAFRSILPDFISIVIGNFFAIIGFFLIYFGFASFTNQKVNLYLHGFIIFISSFVLFPLLTYKYINIEYRIVLVSFLSVFYLLLSAYSLVKKTKYNEIFLNKLLLLILILFSMVRFSRGIFCLLPSKNVSFLMESGIFLGSTMMVTVIFSISLTIGMMQLNTAILESEQKALINNLQKAINEIKTLRGIIPICMYCKNIRNDKGYWDKIESYIAKNSEVDFSHSICPECADKYYPDEKLYDE